MKNTVNSVCTLAALVVALGSFGREAKAAVQVTTSGSAVASNVSLSFDATFSVTTAGTMGFFSIGSFTEDANRDSVRFTGANQLTIRVNNTIFASTYQDFNDGGGRPGVGNSILPALDEYSWVFIGGGTTVVPGDTVRISGTASGGTFIFGNAASTFSLLPSGSYNMALFSSTGTLLSAGAVQAPEPGTLALLALGGTLVLLKRRRC